MERVEVWGGAAAWGWDLPVEAGCAAEAEACV